MFSQNSAKTFVRGFSASSRALLARAQFAGRVGHVEHRTNANGNEFVSYTLAVTRYRPNEEPQYGTEWFRLSAFSPRLLKFFEKNRVGSLLHVDASIRQSKTEGENSRIYNNFVLESIELLGKGRQGDYEEVEVEEESN